MSPADVSSHKFNVWRMREHAHQYVTVVYLKECHGAIFESPQVLLITGTPIGYFNIVFQFLLRVEVSCLYF